MEFLVKKNKNNSHNVTINIPKITVNNAILNEFAKINKKININGFRKGKIPLKILHKKYGNDVYYDVFNRLMQKFFYKFTRNNKIKIIGLPKYYMHDNQDDKNEFFKYSVDYEIYPKIKIRDLTLIEAKKINVKITDEDIKKHAKKTEKWNKINSNIKTHNRVTIDCYVYKNQKEIKKFFLKNISFIVSNNTLLPELQQRLINRKIHDIIFFKVKFSQFHPEQELQNKDINFKIKINSVEKKKNKTLEEDHIKNIEDKQLNKLHLKNIKNNLNKEINLITEQYFHNQIMNEIVKENPISVPPVLLQEEIKNLYDKNQKEYIGKNHNILEKKYHIDLVDEAKKRLCIQIIIEKIIADNKLLIDEKSVQLFIKKISSNHKKPLEINKLYNNNKELKNSIKNIILEMKVMNFLIKKIKVKQEFWNFDQFINYNWDKQGNY